MGCNDTFTNPYTYQGGYQVVPALKLKSSPVNSLEKGLNYSFILRARADNPRARYM